MTGRSLSAAEWTDAGFFFTEAARGGPLAWRPGDPGLLGDPLGPVRHIHEGAAEYYYMFQGAALVEVNGEERVVHEKQLAYIPPDLPHNFWLASDVPAFLFVLVAPNFANQKWRTDEAGSVNVDTDARLQVATPFSDKSLPRGGVLSAEAIILKSGETVGDFNNVHRESIYLVVEGELEVTVQRNPSGTLSPGMYTYVREGLRHRLTAPLQCRVLKFDCTFVPWSGVPLRGGAVA